jgi:hypothetical protein
MGVQIVDVRPAVLLAVEKKEAFLLFGLATEDGHKGLTPA